MKILFSEGLVSLITNIETTISDEIRGLALVNFLNNRGANFEIQMANRFSEGGTAEEKLAKQWLNEGEEYTLAQLEAMNAGHGKWIVSYANALALAIETGESQITHFNAEGWHDFFASRKFTGTIDIGDVFQVDDAEDEDWGKRQFTTYKWVEGVCSTTKEYI